MVNQKTKSGQILLITLLVLTIIGIIVVGIIVLARRDILQVGESKKYEQAYNASETRLVAIVEKYGRYEQDLTSVINDYNECAAVSPNVKYECNFQDNTYTNNTYLLKTKVTIENVKDITGWQVYKDRAFQVNLTGYKETIQLKWSKPAGIDITLIYKDSAGTIKVIKDLFDPSGVFTSMLSDNPYNDTLNIHAFNYAIFDAGSTQTTVQFRISDTAGLLATDTPLTLSITPRLKADLDSVSFDVTATNKGSFPYQMREFTASSFDVADPNTPVATVTTKLPLTPQTDNLFDYALLTDDVLQTKANPRPCSTYNVSKVADTMDGVCDADCSLREAISGANASACPTDKIIVPAGTYLLNRLPASFTYDDTNNMGDLDITVPITIQGAGSGSTIISGYGPYIAGGSWGIADRVFDILSGAKLTIDGVTVQGGRILDRGEGIQVRAGGELVMSNSVISGNNGGAFEGYNCSSPMASGGHFYCNWSMGIGGVGPNNAGYGGSYPDPAVNNPANCPPYGCGRGGDSYGYVGAGSGIGGDVGNRCGGGGGGNTGGGGGGGCQRWYGDAGGSGGGSATGLLIYGTASLTNVTVASNIGGTPNTRNWGDYALGGGGGGSVGIMVYGTLNLSNSIVSYNIGGNGAESLVDGWGGGGGSFGIFVNSGATASISNTTLQYNYYGSGGYTIFNAAYGYSLYNAGTTSLTNVSIYNPSLIYLYYNAPSYASWHSYGVFNAGTLTRSGSNSIYPNCTGCP